MKTKEVRGIIDTAYELGKEFLKVKEKYAMKKCPPACCAGFHHEDCDNITTKISHTHEPLPPIYGYYPGEELLRFKSINSELLKALQDIEERCSNGEPFAGDEIYAIANAAIVKAEGK